MMLGCEKCGTYERHEPCLSCGYIQHIGDDYRCPHDHVVRSKGFEPYYDIGLGQEVTGFGDVNAACRPKWEDDHIVHLQPKDRSAQSEQDLSARREARRGQAMRRR